MGVSLTKGGSVSLSKEAPGLTAIMVGLGWDEKAGGASGADFDLDAVAFMCKDDGNVRSDDDFIFYKNLKSPDGSVVHQGDNLTGAGDGDDEKVLVDLSALPADVVKVSVAVTIHDAVARGQNFGQVSNAFMRIVNVSDDAELARYDLSEDYGSETAVIFGEVYRHDGGWKFKAVGQGFPGGLGPMASAFGVSIG